MFQKFLCVLLPVILLQAKLTHQKELSNYFDVCHLNDPDLNTCIEKAIRTGVPRLAPGIPEIKLPPLDPMDFDSVNMTEGYGNFKFQMILNDFNVEGFSKMKVENVSFDFKDENNIVLKLDVWFPYAVLRGNYIADGRVLIIPLKGNGEVFMNATGGLMKTTMKLRTVYNLKDQKKYLHVKSFDIRISIKGGRSHFSNLFNGNKRLADAVNKFFSEHIPEIFDSIKHLPQQAFSAKFKQYCNILFKSYPFDELLLQD